MSIVRTVQPSLNKAMYFAGLNNYYVIASSFSMYGNNEITILAWTYTSSVQQVAAYGWTLGYGVTRPSPAWWVSIYFRRDASLKIYNTFFGINLWRPSDNAGKSYGYTTAVDRWVHVAISLSKLTKSVKLFVNGSQVSNVDISSDLADGYLTVLDVTDARFSLGANLYGTEPNVCWVANAQVYNRALETNHVKHNMLNPNNPIRENLILWYDARACDTSKNICYDLSGNGNHGTMYNVSIVTLSNQIAPGMVM